MFDIIVARCNHEVHEYKVCNLQHNHETSLWVGLISQNDCQDYQPERAQRTNLKPSRIHSFRLTSLLPLAKRVLNRVRSSTSSFSLQHPLVSLRPSNSCLPLLRRISLTSIPSITRFRRRFLCQLWPIKLTFFPFVVCRIFLTCWLEIPPTEWNPYMLQWTRSHLRTTKRYDVVHTLYHGAI
jgi:hypothetical protein